MGYDVVSIGKDRKSHPFYLHRGTINTQDTTTMLDTITDHLDIFTTMDTTLDTTLDTILDT